MPKSDNMLDTFAFDRVLFFGRTLDEYQRMFNLTAEELSTSSFLDCNAGPASFVAEATALGARATACDPLYGPDIDDLRQFIMSELEDCLDRQSRVAHLFDKTLDETVQYRKDKLAAFEVFARDYPSGMVQSRYVTGRLPDLPFESLYFDLALSSNFLFLYTDYAEGGMLLDSTFDYDFHVRSILELMRVARECRIYPLKGPHRDGEHVYLRRVISELENRGYKATIEPVPYRDVKGAWELLRVTR